MFFWARPLVLLASRSLLPLSHSLTTPLLSFCGILSPPNGSFVYAAHWEARR